ncbi:Core-binding (CB) domain-containing protein, partial [Dysosmobacter welbionis]
KSTGTPKTGVPAERFSFPAPVPPAFSGSPAAGPAPPPPASARSPGTPSHSSGPLGSAPR